MSKINKIKKIFLKLFSILIIFIFVIVFIFLYRPHYFLNNIEIFIENKISENTFGKLDIGAFEGNFIDGFSLLNVKYQENNKIIFSSSEIYINLEISRMIFGKIVLSEVIVKNSYYNYPINKNQNIVSVESILPKFKYEIKSLTLDKSIIIYEDEVYSLYGDLKIKYDGEFIFSFNELSINSPSFKSSIQIPSGSIYFNSEQLIIKDALILSEWINGNLDIEINYKDYSLSNGNLFFDKISVSLNDSTKFIASDINLLIKNSDNSTNLIMTGDVIYKGLHFDKIFFTGPLKANTLIIDKGGFSFMNNNIKAEGSIDFKEYIFNINIIFDEIKYDKYLISSGSAHIKSPLLFNHLKCHLDLFDIQIDSINIDSINGNIIYKNNGLLTAHLNILSNRIKGLIKVQSFQNLNKYNILGDINFHQYDITRYMKIEGRNNLSGNVHFNFSMNNGNGQLKIISKDVNGYFLNSPFSNFTGKTNLILKDNHISGQFHGKLNDWAYANYKWENIACHTEIVNSAISSFDFFASGYLGDYIIVEAKKESSNHLFVINLSGYLSQVLISADPFYLKLDKDKIILPEINVSIDDGLLSLSGNYLNKKNYNLNGTIKNIDLANILSVIQKTPRIGGKIVKGQFRIEDNNMMPLFFSDIEIKDGRWDEIKFDNLLLSNTYYDRRLVISKFQLHTKLGFIKADGWINLDLFYDDSTIYSDDQMNLFITFNQFDINNLNRYLPWGYESRGLLTGQGKITGLLDDLEIIGNIEIKNPGFDKIEADSLSGIISYQKNRLYFNKIYLATKAGEYSGIGNIPMLLNINQIDTVNIQNIPIDFLFTGKTNSIEFIPPYFNVIDSINGLNKNDSSFTMLLEITGNIRKPIRNAEIIIKNAALYLNNLQNPIENINGKLKIVDNMLFIEKLVGRLKKKKAKKEFNFPLIGKMMKTFNSDNKLDNQNLQIKGTINLDSFFRPNFSLQLAGNGMYLISAYNTFSGHGTGNLYITGKDTVFIKGEFYPNPHDFTISNYQRSSNNYIESFNLDSRYIYNINIPFEDGIEIKTDNTNVFIDGDIAISNIGTGNLHYSGKINILDGRYYDNQGNVYENISGNIFISPDQNSSYIDIYANTEIDPSTIDVSIIGNPNNPQIYFSDTEGHYSQTELISILTFGTSDIDFNSNISQFENIFSNYFGNKIERNIAKRTSLDEFQLSTKGSLLSSYENKEDMDIKLILGKRLSKRMYLNTHIDFYDFNDNQYEAEYRLSKNTSVVGGLNTSEGNNSFHIKYRIKYYY